MVEEKLLRFAREGPVVLLVSAHHAACTGTDRLCKRVRVGFAQGGGVDQRVYRLIGEVTGDAEFQADSEALLFVCGRARAKTRAKSEEKATSTPRYR